TKSRIGGAVAALAVRAAVAKKIVAGAGIAAVGASLVACPNPTEAEAPYDADAVRAEVEQLINSTAVNVVGIVPIIPLANYISNINTRAAIRDAKIEAGIAAKLSAQQIVDSIIDAFPDITKAVAKAIINNKSNLLNKKQYIAAANRNVKSIVSASRSRMV
ncbi:hypothetical protein ACYULU_08850, partial [Breznakiellaceae bacterium SP9]